MQIAQNLLIIVTHQAEHDLMWATEFKWNNARQITAKILKKKPFRSVSIYRYIEPNSYVYVVVTKWQIHACNNYVLLQA